VGSGPTEIELGLRMRYELTGVFAPYMGISHQRLLGGTVKIARAAGDDVKALHFVVGFSSAF
jgi:copper resistance protein B